MKQIFAAAIAGTMLSFGVTFALAQTAEPAKVGDTSKGKVLVDAKGIVRYQGHPAAITPEKLQALLAKIQE